LWKYAATKRRNSHIKAKNFYENPATALKCTYAVVRAVVRAAVRAGVCRRTSKTRLFLAGFVRLKYLRQWLTSEATFASRTRPLTNPTHCPVRMLKFGFMKNSRYTLLTKTCHFFVRKINLDATVGFDQQLEPRYRRHKTDD